MIGPEGIKLCPKKIEAVLELPSPWTIKEVQSLNEKLAGLNRFLSKSAEKSLPSLQNLEEMHKKKRFPLDTRSGAGFQTTETTYIITPHIGGTKAKGRATNVLIHLPRSGWRYLDDRKGLNPDASLFCYFMTYKSTISVNEHQTLVEKPKEASMDTLEKEAPQEAWTLFTDGSGAGLILTSPDRTEFTYALRFQFTASNNEAEYEALLAGLRIAAQMGVLVEVLQEKSIQEKEVAAVVEEEGPTWMTPITEYLKDGVLPDDKKEANKLRIKARQYELMDGILYRRSFLRPWLRDARDMILKCKDCQVHRPVPRNPQQPLTPITSPWPFYKWGIDIAGPFPEGPGKKFVWDNIVCRFGLPGEIVSDNGKQFSDNPFKDWCEKLNITHRFASVKHPQSNGLVEIANRSLGKGIKARLGNYRRRRALHKRMDEFMIVRSPSPYNGIIGRPGIREIQAVPSTAHGMLKFLVNGGVVTIRSTILTPNECATITATSKDSIKKIERGQENLKVAIHPDFPDQEVALEGTLSIEGRTVLCILLKMNLDIFKGKPSETYRYPSQIAKHRPIVRGRIPPWSDKKRRARIPERASNSSHRSEASGSKIMPEVYYHEWLSNPVMVKKHDGQLKNVRGLHESK
ncbi:reverse transcriptase domain-containing protein [Tanacetum coccineum]